MSVRLMSKVFCLAIPPKEKLLLLALADCADDDGHECWPSLRFLAWKTSLSQRHVRRLISSFRDKGVLISIGREGGGRRRSVIYRIDLGLLPEKDPLGRGNIGLSPVDYSRKQKKPG
jgi:DNA-binding transcriptional ArsR family regulator